MKLSLLFKIVLLWITFLVSRNSAGAQPEGEDIVIGQSIEMRSDIYDKDLHLSVVLPQDYAESKASYPVLFSVQAYFLHMAGSVEHLSRGQIPEMIHVVDATSGYQRIHRGNAVVYL